MASLQFRFARALGGLFACTSLIASTAHAQSPHIQDAAHFAAQRYCTLKEQGYDNRQSWSNARRDTELVYIEAMRVNGNYLEKISKQYIDAICGERLPPVIKSNPAGSANQPCGLNTKLSMQALEGKQVRIKTADCLLEIN